MIEKSRSLAGISTKQFNTILKERDIDEKSYSNFIKQMRINSEGVDPIPLFPDDTLHRMYSFLFSGSLILLSYTESTQRLPTSQIISSNHGRDKLRNPKRISMTLTSRKPFLHFSRVESRY